jgi:hypothetical protein
MRTLIYLLAFVVWALLLLGFLGFAFESLPTVGV